MSKIIIVNPTLEELLRGCQNPKEAAYNADSMEYSNFMSTCKLNKSISLNTYAKCAKGLGYDSVILHIPSGRLTPYLKDIENKPYYTISEEDFYSALSELNIEEIKPLLQLFFILLKKKPKQDEFQQQRDNIRRLLDDIATVCSTSLDDYEDGK